MLTKRSLSPHWERQGVGWASTINIDAFQFEQGWNLLDVCSILFDENPPLPLQWRG